MIHHNIKLAFRSFQKDKSTFFINLVGLSTGLACAIVIFLWVKDELSIDKFHAKDNQLYRIFSNYDENGEISTERALPPLLAQALEDEVPEVIDATRASRSFGNSGYGLTSNDIYLNAIGRFADDNFFKMFSFEMLEGDENKIFPNKNGIVISESLAKRFYNTTQNVLGKVVTYESHRGEVEAFVSGVFKDLSTNSTFQFDYLLSYDLLMENLGENANWGNFISETYVLLNKDIDLLAFNNKISGFLKTKNENALDYLWAQKFSEGYLNGEYKNGKAAGGRITYVQLFALIALFILLIACINFMNLSTANATKKYKEIGVKKTIGADRRTLIFQYLGESLVLSFISLLIALALVFFLLPQFNLITGKELALGLSFTNLLPILVITLLTGILAGSYPAFYLSGFDPSKIFKNKIKNSIGEVWARKGLVVFQFAVSIILIVSVFVIYQQIEFIQNKKLGFNKDNVVHFHFNNTEAVSQDAFISEIKNIPNVINASSMWGSFIDGVEDTNGTFNWSGKDPNYNPIFHYFHVNYDMLEMLDIKMKEGRSFSNQYGNERDKIIFNEAGAKTLGLANPIGKTFNLWGDDFEIIGVTENFHFNSLYESIQPFFFRLIAKNDADKIMVKIKAGQEQNTLAQLEKIYNKIHSAIPFEYTFLDSDYQRLYESEKRISTLSKYFAGFAIIISCLGLFGLAAFTAQRRMKEISIRKVLGANVFSIVQLLGADFSKMVLIALLIGIPTSYFITQKWLSNFEFRIELGFGAFALAGILVMLVAWLTVSLQTVKAAKVNPVNNLNND